MKGGLTARRCPVCGTHDETKVFASENFDLKTLDAYAFASRKTPEYMHFRLLECPGCALVYADPILPPEKIAALYRKAAFGSQEEAAAAAKTYGRVLDGFISDLPDRKGALDIGTGEGAFLGELLDRGFTDLVGVEPSKAPVKAAQPKVRKLIRNKPFRAGDYRKNSFSLVTCFQTLEHLVEPMALAKAAYALLKPGGVFFVVSHNRKSLPVRMLGRKSPVFDIEHMQLFSPQSAKALFKKAGFTGVKVKGITNRYPLHYWARLFPFPGSLKKPLLNILKRSSLGKINISIFAGNLCIVGLKREVK